STVNDYDRIHIGKVSKRQNGSSIYFRRADTGVDLQARRQRTVRPNPSIPDSALVFSDFGVGQMHHAIFAERGHWPGKYSCRYVCVDDGCVAPRAVGSTNLIFDLLWPAVH